VPFYGGQEELKKLLDTLVVSVCTANKCRFEFFDKNI